MDSPVLRSPFKRAVHHPFSIHPSLPIPLKKVYSHFKMGDSPFKKGEWKGEKCDSPFEG